MGGLIPICDQVSFCDHIFHRDFNMSATIEQPEAPHKAYDVSIRRAVRKPPALPSFCLLVNAPHNSPAQAIYLILAFQGRIAY